MDIKDLKSRLMNIPRDLLFMPPELWGPGASLPAVPDDGQVIVSDRGPDAPPGRRYAVLGFDPDTTERYWRGRPKGERKRLAKAARKLRYSRPPETHTGAGSRPMANETIIDLKRRMVALANMNNEGMTGSMAEVDGIVASADVVVAVWQDQHEADGVGMLAVKGAALLERIGEGPFPTDCRVQAIKCLELEQAVALRDHIGDPSDDAGVTVKPGQSFIDGAQRSRRRLH